MSAVDHGAQIAELVARHYEALPSNVREDRDCEWLISESWSYGGHTSWIVEHHGCCYDGLPHREHGSYGPFPTRVEAEVVLIGLLSAAIAGVESGVGR